MTGTVPTLDFIYRNHRGEIGIRRVTPLRVEFRGSEWHPNEQWILVAFDHDKQGVRDFAMAQIIRFEVAS